MIYGQWSSHAAAFVDIGVHQDGLVPFSQLSDRFGKNPAEVVRSVSKCVDQLPILTPFSVEC